MALGTKSRFILLGWCILAAGAQACDVPVYTYALERWRNVPYPCFVFHRDSLSDDSERAVAQLRAAVQADDGPNIELQVIDVSGDMPAAAAGVWQEVSGSALPLLVLTYPQGQPVRGVVSSMPLSTAAAKTVTGSQARMEITRRLLTGQAAVWVLVASGDDQKDLAVERLLTEELNTIPGKLQLPGSVGASEASKDQVDRPDIRFSVITLSRSDPAEQLLTRALLTSELDLETTYASEPVVFPVFGRGRALYALVGKGINRVNILEACQFLVGPCSCDVEPGFCLPVKADWQQAVTGLVEQQIDLPTLLAPQGSRDQESVDSLAGEDRSPAGELLRNVLVAVALVMAIVLVALLVLSKRLPRS